MAAPVCLLGRLSSVCLVGRPGGAGREQRRDGFAPIWPWGRHVGAKVLGCEGSWARRFLGAKVLAAWGVHRYSGSLSAGSGV